MEPCLLLYNFTEEEKKEWDLALKPVSAVKKKFVAKEAYGLPVGELLSEKPAAAAPYAGAEDFDGRMVLIAGVTANNLFQYLLAVSKMVTEQPVYRAVLTDTNREWSSSYLFRHLQEEEAEIRKWKDAQEKEKP
jgi:hypothetical protein